MKGMILAAGLGTRLRPLSYELPKPIVPVLGRPLCTYNMEFLAAAGGIREFVMNLHRQPKLIEQRVTGWTGRRMRVAFTVEPEILGTGGGILNARRHLAGGTFATANSDTVVRFPFAAALAFHRANKALATLVLFPDPEKRYTPVWVADDGRITGFGDDPGSGTRSGFYTGFQILEPEILARVPPGRAACIVRDTYAPLVREGAPVFGHLCSGYFRDFGSPADYLAGTLALLRERAAEGRLPSFSSAGVKITPPVHVSPGAKISPGAAVGPDAVVEEGATVAEGAEVARSILWPGAVVAAGRVLCGAILTARRLVAVP